MTAESTRSTWPDERLDDLKGEVTSIRTDMTAFRSEMNLRFDRVDQKFDRVDGRIDELHRTLLVVGGGLAASILVSAAGIAATQL